MANSPNEDDLLKLNALVDGELAPAERAEIAARLATDRDLARAYAVLAQLKATIGEAADVPAPIVLPKARRPLGRTFMAAAAGFVVAIGVGIVVARTMLPVAAAPDEGSAEGPTAITLASLPAGTHIPRLDTAGLKLIGLAIDPGAVPLITARYRGPHGCRLDLRAWPTGAEAPQHPGTSKRTWVVGGLTYELVAHGMPKWRFAIIADGAEQQTQAGVDPARVDRRLREANNGAPPCVG
jgi:anti-sigma factor RsiW